ncbi:MAG: putative sugar nucleotidyl transferase [Tepidisphaeraceae bacterium]|jgi:UDP-N-acetylglucosamine diphosphorylase/glucosamine-1-phosphate N-acetyltransferase
MHLVVFEGSHWKSFAPLSISRPVFMLQSGLSTLLEKQIRHIKPTRLTLWVRPALAEHCRRHLVPTLSVPTAINAPLDEEMALLSSGRALHFSDYDLPGGPSVVVDEGELVRKAWAKMPGLSAEDCLNRSPAWLKLLNLPRDAQPGRLPQYLSDLVHWNEEAIVADAIHLQDTPHPLPAGPYHVIGDQNVIVDPQATLGPGVVLDGSKGPVVIEAHAFIGAHSVLCGPCCVGPHSIIAPLSYIREGTSVGPMCKIAGEVSNSIILGYTNKAHYGYLGHSYVGEWVNLGAGTTTSNLKNTYGPIKMHIGKKEIVTDRRFLGSMIGDHVKTAIGTRLMSGTYVGYCSMLAASALPPRFIPSFTFWTDRGMEPYRLDKAREVMKHVFARRGKIWDEEDETALQNAVETVREMQQ